MLTAKTKIYKSTLKNISGLPGCLTFSFDCLADNECP